jgi:lysozyme family protein
MTLRTTAVLVAWSLLASSGCCFAQELENFSDAALTAEQWQQRVQDARRRSEEFVANARTKPADPPPSNKEDTEAAGRRAMHDPSLQRGDIITTSQGFFVFVGRDSEERQPGDFLPVAKPGDLP